MPANPAKLQSILRDVRSEKDFIQRLLIDGLDWEIDADVETLPDISFDWSDEELRDSDLKKKLVEGRARQIQKLDDDQPWGVFLLEFKHPDVFTKGRGMVTPLRSVLRGLVPKRRRDPDLAAWQAEDLLFICTHDWQYYAFAHFSQPSDGRQPRVTSFGWSPETQGRTVIEHNLPHLEWPADPTDAAAWREQWMHAFDKEALTRRFFATFNGLYGRVKGDIAAAAKYEAVADAKALLLVNRLLFLYFIQQKGWLAGRSDFLISAFNTGHRPRPNACSFYKDFLFPLFERLSMPDCLDKRFEQIPFLNGGLFEIDGTQADGDLKIKNSTFAALFDDLFERFNFTITEDTPLDVEVAIDPEMLGKIFEELVTGRHESGSYYTPRPIVSFMCREALKGYLGAGDEVAAFVDEHMAEGLANPEEILEKLRKIRVCDPACGSGAYLVGMLHELMALRRTLFVSNKIDQKNNYKKKLEIIQKNLYGVDIDPVAVHIARLRLWLSLIIEYEGDKPEPLPNLDFKIEEGNSLTGPDPTDSLRDLDLFAHELINEFERKKAIYLAQNVYGDKTRLKSELAELRQQLGKLIHHQDSADGFDWAIEFAEVFGDKSRPGFDAILANPPYVRAELIRELKPALRRLFPEVYSGTADLYCYFYARALELLRPEGMLVFISSNKWYRAGYGERLRACLAQKLEIQTLVDFGDAPVFEAIAYASILSAKRKAPAAGSSALAYTWNDGRDFDHVGDIVRQNGESLPQSDLRPDGWRLESQEVLRLLDKLRRSGQPLGDYVNGRFYRGVLTGLNEAFIVNRATRDRLIAEHPSSAEILKPFLRGRDVKRWRVEPQDLWLIFTRRGINIQDYPAVLRYLTPFKRRLTPGIPGGRKPGSYEWYEIQDNIAYWREFEQPKIIYPDIYEHQQFAWDTNGYFSVNTTYMIPTSEVWLAGLLNSTLVEYFYSKISNRIRGGYLRAFSDYIGTIPIPLAKSELKESIERIVAEILTAKQDGSWPVVLEAEKELDRLVFDLYELEPDEIRLVQQA